MPSGTRIRTDNVYGTLTGALTSGATSMSSAGLANLAAVSGGHAVIVLDPLRAAGAPEVVFVTAHTGSATTATIVRGRYGTAARAHAAGTLWVHAPTIEDFVRIVTSSTRPTDPYEGQLIYETDTDAYKGYSGSAWEHGLTLGAWTAYTPTFTNLTVGNGVRTGMWTKIGRTVHFTVKFVLGSTSAVGSVPTVGLPATAAARYVGNPDFVGMLHMLDAGTSNYIGLARISSTSAVSLHTGLASGTYLAAADLTASIPFTWGNGDSFFIQGTYEAAS